MKRADIARHVKGAIKEVTPPGLLRLARMVRQPRASPYGYFGDYPTFESAVRDCATDGYSEPGIIQRVRAREQELRQRWQAAPPASLLLDGRVLQNLAAALLAVSTVPRRPLSVLDFGGGLGIHYLQLSPFLPDGAELSWLVCETAAMAEEGTRHFASRALKFVSSLDQAKGPFDLLISSGAIQYVPEPMETLARHLALSDRVLFNRVPLITSDRDRLTIHKVDPAIYAANIPTWFFSEARWMARLDELGFDVAMRWEVPQDVLVLDGGAIILQGMLACRRGR